MIDNTKGIDAFSRVEGSRDAWHGLGQVTPKGAPVEVWARDAGLDYHVARVPSYFKAGMNADGSPVMEEVGNVFHLVRDDVMKPIGQPVSEQYHPVQPLDVLQFVSEYFTVDDRFTMETAGALKGGAVIWATARFNAADFQIGGAKHEMFALFFTSFDKSRRSSLRATSTCVVCNNTLQMSDADNASTLSFTHRTKFAGQVRDNAARDFAKLVQGFDKFKEMGDAFATQQVSKEYIATFFKTLLDIPLGDKREDISTRKANQFDALTRAMQDAHKAEAANAPMTKFAALQAVTRYVDHERSARDNGDGAKLSRLYSAQFGSGADLKARAVDLLLAA
jgi:phage/plasmid-like protein (TIGR03299 family)